MKIYNIEFLPANLFFRVETDCDEIKDYISHVYKYMLVKKFCREATKLITMKIEKQQACFYVIFPNNDISTSDSISSVLMWLNREIKKAYSAIEYWPFHGGVVYKNRHKAILIFGESGSGKSTLCYSLLSSGFKCPTDDLVFIHKKNLNVFPMPVSINLRSDVIKLFSDKSLNKIKYCFPDINGDKRWTVERKFKNENIELVAIINVKYAKNKCNFTKLTKFEAISLILKNSYSSNDMHLNYMMTAKIVKNYNVYQMVYNSYDTALEYINKILHE